MIPEKPTPLQVITENIPEKLKNSGPRWCVWKYFLKRDSQKWDKIPFQKNGNSWGSSKHPNTWMDYQTALKLYESGGFDGLGVYVNPKGGSTLNDGFDFLVGVDWDHIEDMAVWGNDDADERIREALDLDSYCEYSPSGTGLRVFGILHELLSQNKRGPREVYNSGRFLTITGHKIESSPDTVKQFNPEGFKTFYNRLKAWKKTGGTSSRSTPSKKSQVQKKTSEIFFSGVDGTSDETVLKLAEQFYSEKFILARDTNLTGNEVSEYDLKFCNYISPFCDSSLQIGRILQQYRNRDKTNTRPDYIERTAERAFTGRKWKYDSRTDTLMSTNSKPLSGDNPILPINNIGLDELTEATYTAIIEKFKGSPILFARNGDLYRIKRDELDRAFLSIVTDKTMTHLACQSVNFVRVTSKGTSSRVYPPPALGRNLLEMNEWEGIPPIVGITTIPVIHSDGSVNLSPGYDTDTKYFYDPGNLIIPSIPSTPNKEQVFDAVGLLQEPFKEFPYSDDTGEEGASFTAIIACLLSVVIRHLIEGPVPLLLIHKPSMGTGASKVCEIIAEIGTGSPINLMQKPENDGEWRKALTSKLMDTPSLVVLDNFEGKLSNPHFSSLLTSLTWSDRLLGQSRDLRLPHRCVWIVNGNNIRLGSDLPRRTYTSNLDACCSNPWERDNFTHSDILGYVRENRANLICAILTIVRGWIQAGSPNWKRPEGVKPLGGFEPWTNIIGGILDYAGITGFLLNQQTAYKLIDVDGPQWDAFFEAWYDRFRSDPITVKELCQLMVDEENKNPFAFQSDGSTKKREPEQESITPSIKEVCFLSELLPDYLGSHDYHSQRFRVLLGSELIRNSKRVFQSGYMLQTPGTKNRARKWQVVKLNPAKTRSESGMSLNE